MRFLDCCTPFQDPTVGCVCGHLIYTSADGNATASTGSAYWRLEEAIKDLESRTGSTMGADGSIFAIRRELHHAAPPDIIDDMYVSCRFFAMDTGWCGRPTRSPMRRRYRARKRNSGEKFELRAKPSMSIGTCGPVSRRSLCSIIAKFHVSHKLLRWLTVYLLGLAGVSGMFGLGLMGQWGVLAALALLGVVFCAAGLAVTSGPLRRVIEVALAFVATGVGVLQSLRGERFQVWTPPASARGGS